MALSEKLTWHPLLTPSRLPTNKLGQPLSCDLILQSLLARNSRQSATVSLKTDECGTLSITTAHTQADGRVVEHSLKISRDALLTLPDSKLLLQETVWSLLT